MCGLLGCWAFGSIVNLNPVAANAWLKWAVLN
jgi:hypothetical protein